MPLSVVLVGAVVVLIIGAVGVTSLALGTASQSDVVRSERGARGASFRHTVIRRINSAFLRFRVGEALSTALIQANIRQIYAIEYFLGGLLVTLLVLVSLLNVIAPFYAVLLAASVGWGLWAVLSYLRERQRQKFIAQLPEFARIMANSTNAGLSMSSSLRVAAHELADPAGRELTILERELAVGTPLDVGLERMSDRIKGRDLDVLVSTLVISQRAGGSLISALRGLSTTLEDRKETRREVKTIVTQSSFTGYLVVAFGVGFVLVMNMMTPGLLYKLTSTVIGQIAIVLAAIAYAAGLLMIHRLTRVKL